MTWVWYKIIGFIMNTYISLARFVTAMFMALSLLLSFARWWNNRALFQIFQCNTSLQVDFNLEDSF